MSEVFGCCSSYQECSDAGQCLHSEDAEYSGCQYRKNLEAGRIFYGKRAGEIIPELCITVKSNNWWSYPAKPEQEKEALQILRKAGITRIPEASGSCTSRVMMQIGDANYIIYAPGTRLIPEAAANEIAGQLRKIILAKVEVMTAGRSDIKYDNDQLQEMWKQFKNRPVAIEPLQPAKPQKYVQISIFELMGG